MVVATLQPIRGRQKVAAAQEALTKLALNLGSGNKLPSVRDMCSALDISAVTIEHVLSGLEEQGVVIRRPGSGIYVSPRLFQKSVGLVFGRHAFLPGASPFCAMLIEACQKRAKENNDNFSFYLDLPAAEGGEQHPVHADLTEALSRKRLDGLLLVARHSAAQEEWLRGQGIPLVTFCGGAIAPFAPMTVGFDLREMADKAIEVLAAKGCRRLGAITPGRSGMAAFRRAMEARDLAYVAELNVDALDDASAAISRFDLAQRATQQLLAASPRVDGIVVFDDMLASGTAAAAREAGLSVGRDLLIASHTNRGSALLQPLEDSLVLVEVDPHAITQAMFAALEKTMDASNESLPAVMVPLAVRIGSNVISVGSN